MIVYVVFFFFFKQKTAYEMRISDWSSDVCSSDLTIYVHLRSKKGPSTGAAHGGVPMMTSPMGVSGSSSFVPMGGAGMPGQRLQMGREDQLWTQLLEVLQEHSNHEEVVVALPIAFKH